MNITKLLLAPLLFSIACISPALAAETPDTEVASDPRALLIETISDPVADSEAFSDALKEELFAALETLQAKNQVTISFSLAQLLPEYIAKTVGEEGDLSGKPHIIAHSKRHFDSSVSTKEDGKTSTVSRSGRESSFIIAMNKLEITDQAPGHRMIRHSFTLSIEALSLPEAEGAKSTLQLTQR